MDISLYDLGVYFRDRYEALLMVMDHGARCPNFDEENLRGMFGDEQNVHTSLVNRVYLGVHTILVFQ